MLHDNYEKMIKFHSSGTENIDRWYWLKNDILLTAKHFFLNLLPLKKLEILKILHNQKKIIIKVDFRALLQEVILLCLFCG